MLERREPPGKTPEQFPFADSARQVLSSAQEEALRLNHDYIGDEHLLLGLTKEFPERFEEFGFDPDKIRRAIEFITEEFITDRGDKPVVDDKNLELTHQHKRVIEIAVEVARYTNQPAITSEHILTGLVFENEGVAAGVLDSIGFTEAFPGLMLSKELYGRLQQAKASAQYMATVANEALKEDPNDINAIRLTQFSSKIKDLTKPR